MSWIRENKFLTAFIAVMVIAGGGLGYLFYSAWGAYAEQSDIYKSKADALHALQTRVPYPSEENLAKYKAQQKDLVAATNSLAASLSTMVLPVEEVTAFAFQDRLRDAVNRIVARAAKAGVKLPAKFAFDMDKYQTQPPPAAAASPLGRQLAALEIAMDFLIDEHVDSVVSLKRYPLAQESAGGGGGGGGGFGSRRGGGGGEDLVEKFPFDLHFIASQISFHKVVNDFATSSKQFFITRSLAITNTDPKPVEKSVEGQPSPAATPAQATGEGGRLKFIVGAEKVESVMHIEIVAFNPPPAR